MAVPAWAPPFFGFILALRERFAAEQKKYETEKIVCGRFLSRHKAVRIDAAPPKT